MWGSLLSLNNHRHPETTRTNSPRETPSETRGKGDVQTEYTIMPVQEACLRTRLLATRRAPALLTWVPARSFSVPSIPSKADRREARPGQSRRAGGEARFERQDRSVALFRDVVGAGRGTGRERGGSPSERIAESMFRLRSGLVGLQGAWRALNDEILPSVAEGEDIAPALRGLLEIIMGIKRLSIADGEEPSATELARLYVDAGRANSVMPLVRMMTALLEHLAREGPHESEAVVQDVVGLWTVILRPKASDPEGMKLPSLRSSKMQKLLRGREPFSAAVKAIMPPTRASQLNGVPAVLLTTYVMMEQPRLLQGDLLTEEPSLRSSGAIAAIEPLLAFTEQLIGAVWGSPDQALREFKDQSPALQSYVKSRLDVLKPRTSPKLDVDQFHRALSRGFKARDPEQIRRTWDSLSRQVEATAPRFADNPALRDRYADLLNFCVCIWCALGHEDVDVVLGFMGEHGFGYTLRTYTSMMEGWKQARRPRNIELLWDRLVADGVPLDPVIWSARISALMTCGLEKPAVRALFELGHLWDEAVKRSEEEGGTKGNAVKPVIGPVNAALTGVLRSKGVAAAPTILNWAAKYNIDPDIATYNMLLRAMFREGRGTEADALLGGMKARGVAADAATFTIIVEEVLGAAAGQTEEAQLAAVRGIFSAIEGSRQKAQVATYAKMIHELLGGRDAEEERGGASSAAVREVLAHMRDSGAEPTPHIFTIVADHHLSRGEVNAVRDMISSWRLEGSDRVDGVFWEVVIKGLARAGLAAEAKAVFFGLRRETRVALGVLDQLLVGLVGEGDREGARGIVAAVRERMGGAWGVGGEGERGERYMKHHFWHVVAEYELDVE